MIKKAIIELDGTRDRRELYIVLFEFIMNNICKKTNNKFRPYHDKIRIAFRDNENHCNTKSNIVISFAMNEENTELVAIYGRNDKEYIFSKTQYRYDEIPNTEPIIIPCAKGDISNTLSIYGHIIDFVFKEKSLLDYKCTKIAVFLDMCYDENIEYQDVVEGMNVAQRVKRNYALDEIRFKFNRHIPIDYKFSRTIVFNQGDPEYEATFTMNMYCFGVYDYDGDYLLMIEYLERDPNNGFNPAYDSNIVGTPDNFTEALTAYMDMFKKAQTAFKPDTDKYESLILSRIY